MPIRLSDVPVFDEQLPLQSWMPFMTTKFNIMLILQDLHPFAQSYSGLIMRTFPISYAEIKALKSKFGKEWSTFDEWVRHYMKAIRLLMLAVAQQSQLEDAVIAANDVYGQAAQNIEQVARGGLDTYIDTLQTRIFALISASFDMATLAAALLKISAIQRELSTIPDNSGHPPGITQITSSSDSSLTPSPTHALSERAIVNAVGRHFGKINR